MERNVTVLTRRGDTRAEAAFRHEQDIVSLVLPGFAATVAGLWAGLDEIEDDDQADAGANGG